MLSFGLLMRHLSQAVPSQCVVCHGAAHSRLCAPCSQRFGSQRPRCERCALELPPGVPVCGSCLVKPPPFTHTLTAVDYGFPWDALVLRLKFSQALDLADTLAEAMANALQTSTLPQPELLLPMPLSTQRLRERGFNQAWELTHRLGRRLSLPTDARLLLRMKDTPHQLTLPEDRRAANVRGAFAVDPLRRQSLAGRHVALVDDVMTTGATAAEAARALTQAGAASVVVWVAARTPRPRDR